MKLSFPKYYIRIFPFLFSLFSLNAKAQIITTVVGFVNNTGLHPVYGGDGGIATAAELFNPTNVTVDAKGNLFIADFHNNRIRKVSTNGIISTVAGNGYAGYSGDGDSAIVAALNEPYSVAVDASGNLFIADWGNSRIRKVDTNGIISTVAGGGTIGSPNKATSARLAGVTDVAVDANGNLYIADSFDKIIRKVDTNGIISSVAGNGKPGNLGDGGLAINAELSSPTGVAVDTKGNLFIADYLNGNIRKVDTSGIISTVAGSNDSTGIVGDGGLATAAALGYPIHVAVDSIGNFFIAETVNNKIRKVDTSGIISTVAGNGTAGYNGDWGLATAAELNTPYGVAVDASGNVLIADQNNNVIRKVTYYPLPITLASFTAILNNKDIAINWQTATELNTNHFIIQHSTDGSSFKDIGNVKATGSGANSYSFKDTKPANGINYYRLESVDKDGATSFSKVVSASLTIHDSRFTIYPNPAKDNIKISGNHIASVQVIDNLGRVVKVVLLKDATNPSITVSSLPDWVYHLSIQTTDGNVSGVGMVKK